MPMLIRGGRLLTMTEQGEMTADVLITKGRIRQIAADITPDDGMTIIEAQGMTLLPGMTDLCIRSGGYTDQWLIAAAACAGITSGILLPDDGDACDLLLSGNKAAAPIRVLHAGRLNDKELSASLEARSTNDERFLVPVESSDECRRVLSMLHGLGRFVILAGLRGCEALTKQIADSGAAALIGVDRKGDSPWRFAASLAEAGVPVALSTFHPSAKLKLLPVCASLCVRDGMQRMQALSAITSTPAYILGLSDRGRLSPSFQADIVIFDGDPLLLATSRVATIIGGKLYG